MDTAFKLKGRTLNIYGTNYGTKQAITVGPEPMTVEVEVQHLKLTPEQNALIWNTIKTIENNAQQGKAKESLDACERYAKMKVQAERERIKAWCERSVCNGAMLALKDVQQAIEGGGT